jgi:hypothetical protein
VGHGNLEFDDATTSIIGSYELPTPEDGGPASYLRLRDVDGDHDLDLVVGMYGMNPSSLAGGRNFIFINDKGHLAPLTLMNGKEPATATDILDAYGRMDYELSGVPLLFDANGDGVNDIVLIHGVHDPSTLPNTPASYVVSTMLSGRSP